MRRTPPTVEVKTTTPDGREQTTLVHLYPIDLPTLLAMKKDAEEEIARLRRELAANERTLAVIDDDIRSLKDPVRGPPLDGSPLTGSGAVFMSPSVRNYATVT
jgi:hypothetical protein